MVTIISDFPINGLFKLRIGVVLGKYYSKLKTFSPFDKKTSGKSMYDFVYFGPSTTSATRNALILRGANFLTVFASFNQVNYTR